MVGVIIVLGTAAVVASRSNKDVKGSGPQLGDHWHAAVGVNICGTWQPNVPEYHNAVGVHSHGDGLMHMHPTSTAGTGSRANLGLYLGDAGPDYDIGAKFVEFLGKRYEDGDRCPDGKKASLRWSVNGKVRTGDPSKFVPNEGDVVAIAFLPEGREIGTPPQASARPTDVAGAQQPLPDLEPTVPTENAPAEGLTEPGVLLTEPTVAGGEPAASTGP